MPCHNSLFGPNLSFHVDIFQMRLNKINYSKTNRFSILRSLKIRNLIFFEETTTNQLFSSRSRITGE